jgi:hypothetical protein
MGSQGLRALFKTRLGEQATLKRQMLTKSIEFILWSEIEREIIKIKTPNRMLMLQEKVFPGVYLKYRGRVQQVQSFVV